MIYDQEEKLTNEELMNKIDGKLYGDDWALDLTWIISLITYPEISYRPDITCPHTTQPPKDRRINIDDLLSSVETKSKGRESMPPRSKLIRRQKILTCNTVEDEQGQKLDDLNIYVTHTPKYPKT